ncbi:hypothetical protein [Halostagnicola sp. A-GB9-2]|uniref:hypothetical protein n=1 Tax=Halostagnicola sp. A-GB9-2 TaxID=3048066 RepID=UPI0024C085D7|nr:hypothetical protein [Halostagnicola sp. A-GB9-2]MDJ1432639.1 hypothetical protein [Halostagnicola sp. A-GB9-2]
MGFSVYSSLTSHVTALVPIVVLSTAGFLLVQTLREARLKETAKSGAIAGTFFVSSYVLLSVVLAEISTWIPEEEGTGTATGGAGAEESEAIAVAVDSSLVLTTVGTVLSIALIGGAIAVFVYHLSGRTESPRSRTADSVQSESDEVSS